MTKKKLLILGGTFNDVVIVQKAQAMGIHTIVTDRHTDLNRTPAKRIADEHWTIDWSDVPALEEKCRQEHVDGVFAGFDELRLDNLIILCERLNFPCYINKEQLDVTRDKSKFKQYCREMQIPTVRQYGINDSDITFPVIVKPVDRAGGLGINVAYNREQYDRYLEEALSLSLSKSVIVEDYMADAVKFDCYYVINNSVVDLIMTSDTLMHCNSGRGHETNQKAWMMPSLYESEFLKQYDEKIKNMIRHLGFVNGCANISCFYKDGSFYVFEAGFRLTGELSCDYQYADSNSSYLDTLIRHAMGLPVQGYIKPSKHKKAFTNNLYMTTSCVETVVSIEGLEALKNDASVISAIPKINIGAEVQPDGPTKFAMITFLADTFEEVRRKIDLINKTVCVNTESSSVYYSDSDVPDEVLKKYWKE